MQSDDFPQKFFWRRVGTFFMDWVVISIPFLMLTVVLQPISPVKLLAPETLKFTSCGSAAEIFKKLDVDRLVPLQPGETRIGTFCTIRQFGIWPRYELMIGGTRPDGGFTYSRSVNVNVDAEGNPIEALSMGNIMAICSPLLFALLLFRRGQTPGKRLVKLRVRRSDGASLTFSVALYREAAKLFPFVVAGAIGLYLELTFNLGEAAGSLAELFATTGHRTDLFGWAIVFAVAVLVYWLLPFLHWRGQTFYDKWLGLELDRAGT